MEFTRVALFKAVFAFATSVLLLFVVKLLGVYSIVFPLLFMFLDVSYFLRVVWIVLKSFLFRKEVQIMETSETTFCVLTTDIDLQGHMNNSRYLRECDFGRINHWLGSGFYQASRKHGLGIVLGALTIRYRRSLELFQIVHLRSKILYWDEKALYLEQQFINSNGFVCAVAIAKQSIVQKDKKKNYPVTPDQLIHEVTGKQVPKPNPPKELESWIEYNSASSLSLKGCS